MTTRAAGGKPGSEGRALQAALELLVTAAGTIFLALGLRQWVAIAWSNDTTAARTPVAYAARVHLPAEAAALPPAAKWIIAASAMSSGTVCARAMGPSALRARGASVAILVADRSVARLATCTGTALSRGRAVDLALIHRELGWIPVSGFIVVDRAGLVVYGSYDLSYLPHVLPSLALLD